MRRLRMVVGSAHPTLVTGHSLVTGHWSLVTGHWSLVTLVTGHWSLVTGHWPLVTGHWSLATEPLLHCFFETRRLGGSFLVSVAKYMSGARGLPPRPEKGKKTLDKFPESLYYMPKLWS